MDVDDRSGLVHTALAGAPLGPRGVRSSGQGRVTTVAGTEIAWTEQGAGEAIVLLHGIGDSGRTWARVAPALAARYRVLVPDLPGHGLSGRPDAPYTLAWFATVLAAWMMHIGLRRAHLVGHSFGGGVAQWLLLHHREQVDRLAHVAAGGLGREVAFGLRLAAIPFPERFCTPAAMRLSTLLGRLASRKAFGYPGLAEIWESARLNGIDGTGRAFCRTVRGVIDLSGQFMQTRAGVEGVPTLPPIALFWGAEDRIIPVGHGRLALTLFDGATLEVFAGCGHYPHLQEPARFAAELLSFLDDAQRAPARLSASARPAVGALLSPAASSPDDVGPSARLNRGLPVEESPPATSSDAPPHGAHAISARVPRADAPSP